MDVSGAREAMQADGRTVQAANDSTSLAGIITYALPAAPLSFMTALAGMYLLKFATDVLLIAPGLFATFFMISKGVDAISDPVAGYASDRTRLASGRRRPWILAAVIPMCVTFWGVWSPPASVGPELLGWWLGFAVVLYYLAYTVAVVPHLALGAELSIDHHERTRIFGARALLEFVGMGAAVAAMASLQTSDEPGATAQAIAACFSLATVVLLATGALRTRERLEYQAHAMPPPGQALKDVVRNPHARIVIGVLAIDSLSFSMMGVLFPFLAAYVMTGDAVSSSYIALAIAAAVVLFPTWFLLARRFGKRAAWLTALCMRIAGFAAILLAGPQTTWLSGVALFLVGGSLACTFIIPPSIKSDVIDYDELMTGDRKEGSYFAAWNLLQKLAAGAAIGIAGLALQAVGYEANAVQDPTTITAMLFLFAGVPLLLHLIAVALLLRLRLDAAEHERIRSALTRRRTGRPIHEVALPLDG